MGIYVFCENQDGKGCTFDVAVNEICLHMYIETTWCLKSKEYCKSVYCVVEYIICSLFKNSKEDETNETRLILKY